MEKSEKKFEDHDGSDEENSLYDTEHGTTISSDSTVVIIGKFLRLSDAE
jgi:hypothetical protein